MKNHKRDESQEFAIAMKQVKMDASRPSQARDFERKVTSVKLTKIGLTTDSPEYRSAYKDALRLFAKTKKEKEARLCTIQEKGPLAFLFKMKEKALSV